MTLIHDTVPRVKPIYPVYRVNKTIFRIGAQLGITVDIDDENGQVWTLVHLMDGTRSFQEIVAAMQAQFPSLCEEDIELGIRTLDEEGLLEDARPSVYDDGNSKELVRFIGNVNYFSHFSHLADRRGVEQDRLRKSKVVLLGLGGGGSNILTLLAAAGVGNIVAVDYDRVELTNLNRQFSYRETDIGNLKTHISERIIAEMNSSITFSSITKKIESAGDVRAIIPGADLVICAIDEPNIVVQRRVNRACVIEGIPCLYGISQVTRGRVFSVLPHQSGCADCLHVHYSKNDPLFSAQLEGFFESDFEAPTIAFVPQIVRLCGTIVDEAVRLLTDYTKPLSIATQLELDYVSGSLTPLLNWPRYENECPTCGAGHEDDWPVFALYKKWDLAQGGNRKGDEDE